MPGVTSEQVRKEVKNNLENKNGAKRSKSKHKISADVLAGR